MDLRQSEAWQRRQLATTERMQADISRYTRPVMSTMGINSMFYLMTWGPLFAFRGADKMPWLPLMTAALSACIIALIAPAFALAVRIECYFFRRLNAAAKPTGTS